MPRRVEDYEKDPAYSALQKETGLRIAAIRKLAGMTQEEAIGNLGVSQPAWSKWERGLRMPNPFIMMRFASRFKVSLDLIYRGIPSNSHPELIALLRSEVPELMVEPPMSKAPDKGTAQALYKAAISHR